VPKPVKNESKAARETDARYQHDRGNALAEEGRLDQAITAFRRALRVDDTLAEVHNDLGTAYFEKQWYEQAEQCFRRAIALRPDHGVAHANLGAALRAQGRLREGRAAFQRALVLKVRAVLPPFLRWNTGAAAQEDTGAVRKAMQDALALQQVAQAQTLALDALKRFPKNAEINHLASQVFERLGHAQQALTCARRAVELENKRATYQVALTRALVQNGEPGDALRAAESAVALEPDSSEAFGALSLVLRLAQKLDAAEHAARRSVELEPQRADAHVDLALVLRALLRLEEAEAAMREAIRLAPQEPRNRVHLALILKDAGKVLEAKDAYRAVAAELAPIPNLAGGLCLSLGTLALECDADAEQARKWFALAIQRGEADRALLSESVADLLEHRFAIGWPKFEARKRVAGQRERHEIFAGWPVWDGHRMKDERLLVYNEQGIGDEILLASMLPDLLMRAPNVTLLCDPRLHELLARSFPQVEVLRATHDTLGPLRSRVNSCVAAGSLGQYLRRSAADFPGAAAYLQPDGQKLERWRERVAQLGAGPKIGLSWMGGVLLTGRQRRSFSLERLRQVLAVPGVTWVCLQHGEVAEEVAAFRASTGIAMHTFPGVTQDIDDLAGLVAALDMVVTVGNTNVHVAGGLGTQVLVMAPYVPLWAYGIRGERMPWYPSVRVLRQGADGDWGAALAQVATAVQARASRA
jgi:tetratricopeptide (TPR) repeat protein